MATPVRLPYAHEQYDQQAEQVLRNTLENELQDIRNEMDRIEMNRSTTLSLSRLRHHFLLMGAASD